MKRSEEEPKIEAAPSPKARTEYTEEELAVMEQKLLALPPIEAAKRKRNKQGAVIRLAKAIATLQERDYTIEDIADSLRGVGLDLSTPTLKSYLQRAKEKDEKVARKKRKSPGPSSGPAPAQPQVAATADASVPAPKATNGEQPRGAPKTTNDEFLSTDRKRL